MSNGWRQSLLALACYCTGLSASLMAESQAFVDGAISVPLKDAGHDASKPRPADFAAVRILPEHVPPPEIPSGELEAFGDYLEELWRDLGIPGCAIAVMQEDRVILQRTLGLRNVTRKEPVDAQTLFNIGPATMAFSSLLAATLDGESGYSYDKLARRIWPRFRMSSPQSADSVTVANLFTMTAGVPSYIDNILDPAWARPEDVFEAIAQAPVVAPPGRIYEHSRMSAAAAGFLTGIAARRGDGFYEAYTTAAANRLFVPMGMHTATFSPEAAEASGNVAASHQQAGAGYDPAKRWEPEVNAMAPALGLKASLRDMQGWLATELQLGRTPEGERIASELSVRQRWQPALVRGSNHFGMGWKRQYYRSVEIIASMGSYDRQSAVIGLLPAQRTGFIVLTNSGGEASMRLMQEVALGLAEMFTAARTKSLLPQLGKTE